MKADSLPIARIFSGGGDVHYVLPQFQRPYAWEKAEWDTLLKDAFDLYETAKAAAPGTQFEHFLGALVVIPEGNHRGTMPVHRLVDGQQRLVTMSLVLLALAQLAKEHDEALARRVRRLLFNDDASDVFRYKIAPTEATGDRATYFALLDGHTDAKQDNTRLVRAYRHIYAKLHKALSADGPEALERFYSVLANGMHCVFIALASHEHPYRIFESLNAKGKDLTQSDLVRNYLAMRLSEAQQQVYTRTWVDVERRLSEERQVERIPELSAFLRHLVGYHTAVLPNRDKIYARLRDWFEQDGAANDVQQLEALHQMAVYYERLVRPETEPDPDTRAQLHRLNSAVASTAYPFVLGMDDARANGHISREGYLEGLRVLENYLIRRVLGNESSSYTNRMFPTLWKEVTTHNFVASLQSVLARRNYPSDARVRQYMPSAALYSQGRNDRLKLILESINRHLSRGSGGHTVLDGDATVEHIMPQTLSDAWKSMLGLEWERVHREWLNAPANLTLVTSEWNSSLSNAPYDQKRQQYARHALRLNADYFGAPGAPEVWNEAALQARAAWLAERALEVWPSFAPRASAAVEDAAITRRTKPQGLIMRDELYELSSWREAVRTMTRLVMDAGDEAFMQLAQGSKLLKREARDLTEVLPNGWHLYTTFSAPAAERYCALAAKALGLDDDEWEIVYDDR